MATKLRALYQRRKGRDLFDVWYAVDCELINLYPKRFKYWGLASRRCEQREAIQTI